MAPDPLPGAELERLTRRRLTRVAVVSNGLGGLAVFAFGLLAPGSPDADDGAWLAIANALTLLVFVTVAFPLGLRAARRAGEPLRLWLLAETPATPEQQDLALSYPTRLTTISVVIWGIATLVFTAVNATYSAGQAASAAVVTPLGGTVCCALVYLLTEQVTRPVVARALAGRAPPRTRGPSVAARLTMAWTLVTGVPLLGIAAIIVADLAGAEINTLATGSMLLLAVTGLGAGLTATLLAARSVGDPVRSVEEAMASVERGAFDVRVPVEDGSEVGRLQAGFNRMAAGLAERERPSTEA